MTTALKELSETRPWGREIGAEWDEPTAVPPGAPKSKKSRSKTAYDQGLPGAKPSADQQLSVLRVAITQRADPDLSAALVALYKNMSWVKSAGEDTLKKIRHALYQRGMKKEADMFRTESLNNETRTALKTMLNEASETSPGAHSMPRQAENLAERFADALSIAEDLEARMQSMSSGWGEGKASGLLAGADDYVTTLKRLRKSAVSMAKILKYLDTSR